MGLLNGLRAFGRAVHTLAIGKGWYDPPREVGTSCALIHGEVSELMETFRRDTSHLPSEKIPTFSNAEEEMADIVIRVLDFAESLGYDVPGAMEAKHQYNQGRAHRHGGKNF